jgi:dolichyl-phosphate mannosyltransferase polypeptide 2 regulatory subunit
MAVSDKALGGLMLLVASSVFTYYTTWAMLLPFFDASNVIHSWFPPREWAVRLPAFILVVGLSAIGVFLGSTIIKEKQRKAEQAKLRMA